VLLIEDNLDDATLVRRSLGRSTLLGEFDVTHAASFRDAVAQIDRDWDAIVLDLSLPDHGGLAMLEDLRGVFGATPVVVLSGREDGATAVEAVKRGAQDYLPKGPIALDRIAHVVTYAVERHRTQLQLAEARAELEEFFNLSLEMLAIAGTSGVLERVNPAWERYLGWAPPELTSRPFIELVHPDDRAEMLAEIQAVQRGRPLQGFRNRFLARDGRHHWLEWSARVTTKGRLYCAVRDVTEQHEAALRLEESETRFRALAEGSIEGIVVERVQDDFRPLYANFAAARMYGFESVQQLMAMPSLSPLAPPASLAMARDSWPLLVQGIVPFFHGRVEMKRRDGTPIWVELMGTKIDWGGDLALQMTLIDVTERVRLERELERLATTDPLTGLTNRRVFSEAADRELRRARRHLEPLSVLIIDADHFKTVNDTYGHPAGDEVLRQLAAILLRSIRDIDLVCRWGGEEFVVMLIGVDATRASLVAERIRAGCAEARIESDGQEVRATVSVGVTDCRPEETIDGAVARADRGLYLAKSGGRNRVEIVR
jgi:diguanylate cyclase (GGDEF)-like protein/PAS domain S-box-containing protein